MAAVSFSPPFGPKKHPHPFLLLVHVTDFLFSMYNKKRSARLPPPRERRALKGAPFLSPRQRENTRVPSILQYPGVQGGSGG